MSARRKPAPARTFLTTQEVAHMLQISDTALRTKLRNLQEDEGFPMEMPHQKRPKLFSRRAVESWLEGNMALTASDVETGEMMGLDPAEIRVLAQAQARL